LKDDKVTVDPSVTEGSIAKAVRTTNADWVAAKSAAKKAAEAVDTAVKDVTLQSLRETVLSTTEEWNTQQAALVLKEKTRDADKKKWDEAAEKLEDDIEACQIKQYDIYRKTLEKQLAKRRQTLKDISAELAKQGPKKAGTAGARCEKAPSQGRGLNPRITNVQAVDGKVPEGSMAVAGAVCEMGLCCGAARIWMTSGVTPQAAWKTIETCQPTGTKTYNYVRARLPMEVAVPNAADLATAADKTSRQTVAFTCIEGAQRLAAATAALATAVYMLA